ncbi:MAG: serine hydrolase [Clostridia bacterium]|nr:serine hydrolase [Clostridia bacterium]MBQ7047382.1 serine hydrolase [Clostridia bacterium]
MLRRILAFVLCLALCVPFCGCNKETVKESGESSVKEEASYAPPVMTTIMPDGNSDILLPDMIDESFTAAFRETLDNAPYACALYYVDLETGLSITYNPDRMFAGASLIKAEYLMMIFEMIENGQVSYDNMYTYTAGNKKGGTTKIPYDYEFGDKLSLKEIIEYVVWHSDNTGYNMLQVYVRSYWDIMDWADKRYGTKFEYEGCNWLNARGVAECWKEIYDRYKNGDENYQWYVSLLLEANENKFIKGGLPKGADGESMYEVAHKYGMDINASNDAAIVFYEDRPYFLTILTDYIGINTQSFMNEVSSEVFAMHEKICSYNE